MDRTCQLPLPLKGCGSLCCLAGVGNQVEKAEASHVGRTYHPPPPPPQPLLFGQYLGFWTWSNSSCGVLKATLTYNEGPRRSPHGDHKRVNCQGIPRRNPSMCLYLYILVAVDPPAKSLTFLGGLVENALISPKVEV